MDRILMLGMFNIVWWDNQIRFNFILKTETISLWVDESKKFAGIVAELVSLNRSSTWYRHIRRPNGRLNSLVN